MIRKINILSFLFLIVISLFSLFTYHDDMDVHIPFIDIIFIVLSIILGLLLFLKVNLRWQALALSFKSEGYKIGKIGFKNTIVYEAINIVFYFLVGLVLMVYVSEIWFVGLVIFLHFIEGVLHLITNAIYHPYKIINNKNSLMIIANSFKTLRWSSIKKVEGKHNDIHLVNKLDQVYILDLDLLSKEDGQKLTQEIKAIALERNLYFGVATD